MKSIRYGETTFQTDIKLDGTREQAEQAFQNLKKITVKFVSFKKDYIELRLLHDERYNNDVKNLKTLEDLLSFEKNLSEEKSA